MNKDSIARLEELGKEFKKKAYELYELKEELHAIWKAERDRHFLQNRKWSMQDTVFDVWYKTQSATNEVLFRANDILSIAKLSQEN